MLVLTAGSPTVPRGFRRPVSRRTVLRMSADTPRPEEPGTRRPDEPDHREVEKEAADEPLGLVEPVAREAADEQLGLVEPVAREAVAGAEAADDPFVLVDEPFVLVAAEDLPRGTPGAGSDGGPDEGGASEGSGGIGDGGGDCGAEAVDEPWRQD
jgi:hypothetical protein